MGGQGRQGPRRGSPGPPLSRDQILDAALRIVETEGLDALTIRGLAAKIGVAVTAVYWHVGDKQALLDGLAERVIEKTGEVQVSGRGHRASIMSIGRSLRSSLLERPDLIALVHRQGRTQALFQPARKVLVAELGASGLGGRDAGLATQAILSLVVGSVLIDRQVERQPVQLEGPGELWDAEDVAGDSELFEFLVQPVDEGQLFDYTLDVLVRAVLGNSASR